jgi:IS1 family transposase
VAQKKGRRAEPLAEQVKPPEEGDVLELDECWTYVRQRSNKRWLWVALCRRTRQIVAFVIGDRSAKTCARLWAKIPSEYREKQSFSDFWKSYRPVFEQDPTHEQVGKGSGELSHVERFFGLIRQRLSRYARETRAASQTERMLHLRTKLFVDTYNRAVT